MRQFCSVVVTVLFVWCAGVQAEVYKWTDENGKVHFGDKVPRDKPAEDLSGKVSKTNVDHGGHQLATAPPVSREKTEDEKRLAEQQRAEREAVIGESCRKLKADIESVARGERGWFVDENGDEEIVLERDRGKKLEEWKATYSKVGCEELYPLEQN